MSIDISSSIPEATALVAFTSLSVLVLFFQGLAIVSSTLVQKYYSIRFNQSLMIWRVHAIWGSLFALWMALCCGFIWWWVYASQRKALTAKKIK